MAELDKLNALIREACDAIIDDEKLREDSLAAKAAKAKGLVYAAFGRWKDKATGKVVAKSDGDKLQAVKPGDSGSSSGGDSSPETSDRVKNANGSTSPSKWSQFKPSADTSKPHADSDAGMHQHHNVDARGPDSGTIAQSLSSLDSSDPKAVNSYLKNLSNDDLSKHDNVASQEAVYRRTNPNKIIGGHNDEARRYNAQRDNEQKRMAALAPAISAEKNRRIALAKTKSASSPTRPVAAPDRPPVASAPQKPSYKDAVAQDVDGGDEDEGLNKWLSDMESDEENSDIEPGTRY